MAQPTKQTTAAQPAAPIVGKTNLTVKPHGRGSYTGSDKQGNSVTKFIYQVNGPQEELDTYANHMKTRGMTNFIGENGEILMFSGRKVPKDSSIEVFEGDDKSLVYTPVLSQYLRDVQEYVEKGMPIALAKELAAA